MALSSAIRRRFGPNAISTSAHSSPTTLIVANTSVPIVSWKYSTPANSGMNSSGWIDPSSRR